MSNDGNNADEGFYSPEAFAMAAWGLLTVMVEKLKELEPDFDARAIRLFDHFLGRTIGGAKYLNKSRAAILAENRIAWRRFMNRLMGDGD